MDLRGTIVQLFRTSEAPDSPILGALELRSAANRSGPYDAAITMTRATRVYRRDGATDLPASLADLAANQLVEVWFAGPVQETFPIRATAAKIVVCFEA